MTNAELNKVLYQKMFAEQETYREWLLSQLSEEILNHTYEYTVREDILLSMEYNDLPDAQVKALLKSPSSLADVFKDWEHKETGYMEDIWQTVADRAKSEVQKQKKKKKNNTDDKYFPACIAGKSGFIEFFCDLQLLVDRFTA